MCLHCKEMPAATHARLNFVGDQQCAVSRCLCSQCLEELVRQVVGAGDSLHRFENYAGHVSSIIARAHSMSSRGMKSTSNGLAESRTTCPQFQVTAAAAAVRPWKPWVIASTFLRPVAMQAMRNAFSLASAPEFTKNTRSIPCGAICVSCSAASARMSSATALLWNKQLAALFLNGFQEARVTIAKRRDRVPAVEVKYLPAIAVKISQPLARSGTNGSWP